MHYSDNELIKNYLAGEADALNVLISRYQKEAVRIAYTVLSNEADSFDAAQEAFIKVFKNLARFGGRSKFSTWFYRIVYNSALDIGRKRKRYVQHSEDEDNKQQFASPEFRADGEAPEDIIQSGEEMAIIKECLEELPFKYNVVIKLKDVEGLSYDEIAEVIGISRGNVMSRLYYGREKLRSLLRRKTKQE